MSRKDSDNENDSFIDNDFNEFEETDNGTIRIKSILHQAFEEDEESESLNESSDEESLAVDEDVIKYREELIRKQNAKLNSAGDPISEYIQDNEDIECFMYSPI